MSGTATSATPTPPPAGSAKLAGAAIGTAGSYKNLGNPVANAFDGNPATFFDAAVATGAWAGLDLGSPQVITRVQFQARGGFNSRMNGGLFQGSTTPDFSAGVTTLATVTAIPAGGKYTAVPVTAAAAFQYVRYVGPANAYCDVAELEFDGVAPPAPAVAPAAPVVTAAASAAGVQLAWPADPTATSDTVLRQGPADAAPVVIGTTAGGVATFTDVTAAAGTTYAYTVVATNAAGSSPASTPVTVTTPVPSPTPAAPTGLTALVSSTDVLLSWTADPTTAATSFTVERQGPTDAGYVVIGTAAGTATTFDDVAVTAGTTYAYVVIANGTAGASSAPSGALTATPPGAVAAPTPTPTPTPTPVATPPPATPGVWSDADIGSPAKAGGAVVSATGSIAVTGGGADIWNQTDQFNFDAQTLVGNGTVTVQVSGQTDTNGWAKAGIMVRESTDADARFVLLALTPGNGVTWQVRSATHTMPTYTTSPGKAGVWLQITRVGSTFTGATSTDGVNWKTVGLATITMPNNVGAGLAVTAHDNTKASTATFANVAVTAAGPAASAWSLGAAGPMARWESETFTYNGKLYVFGGFIDRSMDATAECDVYDPAANAWSYVTTVPVGGLTHASTTVVGDTVYFAGGTVGAFVAHEGGNTTAAVLTYNLTTDTWGATTPLPVASSCGGLVCINDVLYYYGGLNADDSADLTATWALDLSNPSAGWAAKAAMPNGRNHLGAVAINGVAYAVGGWHLYNTTRGAVAEVDAYDPVTNTWRAVASLPQAWSSIETSTTVADGKIVVVGGGANGGYDGTYQTAIASYDPVANSWANVGTLPEANEGLSAAYVNGQLIVADGTVDNLGGWAQDQVWSTTAITF